MLSKKKSGAGTTLIVVLLVTVILGCAAVAVYVTGISPDFNAIVDIYLEKKDTVIIEPVAESEPEVLIQPVETIVPEEFVVPPAEPDDTAESGFTPIPLIDTCLIPDDTAARLMVSGFRTWTGTAVTELPELSFLYPRNADGSWSYPVLSYDIRLIPFVPADQGMYTVGLANSNGGWISAMAFVAVFEDTGEQLAVSVDYHADRPQVTLHLRDDRLYYIAQGYFTEEEPIPEGTVVSIQEAR